MVASQIKWKQHMHQPNSAQHKLLLLQNLVTKQLHDYDILMNVQLRVNLSILQDIVYCIHMLHCNIDVGMLRQNSKTCGEFDFQLHSQDIASSKKPIIWSVGI